MMNPRVASKVELHLAITIASLALAASGCSKSSTDQIPQDLVQCYSDSGSGFGSDSGSGSAICVTCQPNDDPSAVCASDCGGEDTYPQCGCESGSGSGSGSGSPILISSRLSDRLAKTFLIRVEATYPQERRQFLSILRRH
jgi:hypothetical protein